MPTISREDFEQAVTDLSGSNGLNISSLAKSLGVSRGWLYENFPEVRNLSRRLSNDEVLAKIEQMRAERPSERFTVEEVSRQLGITRQTFSRNFRHLYNYLNPDSEVFEPSSAEEKLLAQVKILEQKVKQLTDKQEAALQQKEKDIFSTLMRQDAEEFETLKTSSSIKRLQDQAENHAQFARQKTREVAELRLEIAKLKSTEVRVGCDILNHMRPDYSPISSAAGASLKDVTKLFNEAEKRNLAAAEEIIVEQRPDHVILFQPYLACDRTYIPALPLSGRVILVESNVFREDIRKEFVKNIQGIPVISIYAQTTLARTKMFAQGAKIPLGPDFIEKLHKNIMPPVLEDGFSAVMSFDPHGFLK